MNRINIHIFILWKTFVLFDGLKLNGIGSKPDFPEIIISLYVSLNRKLTVKAFLK